VIHWSDDPPVPNGAAELSPPTSGRSGRERRGTSVAHRSSARPSAPGLTEAGYSRSAKRRGVRRLAGAFARRSTVRTSAPVARTATLRTKAAASRARSKALRASGASIPKTSPLARAKRYISSRNSPGPPRHLGASHPGSHSGAFFKPDNSSQNPRTGDFQLCNPIAKCAKPPKPQVFPPPTRSHPFPKPRTGEFHLCNPVA
jgi:hypothetical protein